MAMEEEKIEVNDTDNDTSDDDVNNLYNELYDDLIKAKRNVILFKKIIITLEINIEVLQKENDLSKKKIGSLDISLKVCQMCETLKAKGNDLTKSLEKFTNDKKNLDTLLGNQRHCFNKERISYEKIVSKDFFQKPFL